MKRHFFCKTSDWSFLRVLSFAANAKFSFIRLEMSQVKCKKSFLGNSNSQPWPVSPSFVMIEGKSHSQTFFNCHIHCNDPGQEKASCLTSKGSNSTAFSSAWEKALSLKCLQNYILNSRLKNFVLTEMIKANVFLLHIFLHTLNIFGGRARNENEDIISAAHHISLNPNNGTL